MSDVVTCPFCGVEPDKTTTGIKGVMALQHPVNDSCPMSLLYLTIKQWAMRPPSKPEPSRVAETSDGAFITHLINTEVALSHIDALLAVVEAAKHFTEEEYCSGDTPCAGCDLREAFEALEKIE